MKIIIFIQGFFKNIKNLIIDRNLKKKRLKIYGQYKDGKITYNEYVKQRKDLEKNKTHQC